MRCKAKGGLELVVKDFGRREIDEIYVANIVEMEKNRSYNKEMKWKKHRAQYQGAGYALDMWSFSCTQRWTRWNGWKVIC